MLSWSSATNLQPDSPTLQALMAASAMRRGVDLDRMPKQLASFPWLSALGAVGDVCSLMVPRKQGIEIIMESACGFLPVLGLCAELVAAGVQKERHVGRLLSVAERIKQAQIVYVQNHGHFATSLWELGKDSLIAPEVSKGIHEGFLFRVQPTGQSWWVEFRRERDGARFSYRPEAGRIQALSTTTGNNSSSQ
jgi:hypothetical protein